MDRNRESPTTSAEHLRMASRDWLRMTSHRADTATSATPSASTVHSVVSAEYMDPTNVLASGPNLAAMAAPESPDVTCTRCAVAPHRLLPMDRNTPDTLFGMDENIPTM